MYALTFSQVKEALAGSTLEDQLDGIPIRRLIMAAGTGDTLPEAPNTATPGLGPLTQQPILILDHSSLADASADSIWDEGDTLLFWASGTSLWKRVDLEDSTRYIAGMEYYFSSNYYSFTRNFYLGVLPTGSTGLRLDTLSQRSGGSTINQTTRYVRAEKDLLLRDTYFGVLAEGWESNSGREWFWIWCNSMMDSVELTSGDLAMTQTTSLPGLKGTSGKVAVAFFPYRSVAVAITDGQLSNSGISDLSEEERFQGLNFRLSVNSSVQNSDSVRQPGGQFVYSVTGLSTQDNTYDVMVLPNSLQYDRFDGYTVAYPCSLAWRDSAQTIYPGTLGGLRSFHLNTPPSSLQVLKLSGEQPLGFLPHSSGVFTDSLLPSLDIRYHLFKWGDWLSVSDIEPWEMSDGIISDLTSLSGDYDYVLLTPHSLVQQALRLQALRSGTSFRDQWRTAVVDLDMLYQQFGGGYASPVAIRDFLRYAREQWSDLRFALLVGSGHADPRQIRSSSPEVMVPLFEREAVGTDDYFTLLDSGEALFSSAFYDHDLAIGRLVLSTPEEVSIYIDKLKEYEDLSVADNSNWRNTLLIAADDAMQGTSYDEIAHTEKVEAQLTPLETAALSNGYEIDIDKLYLLTYERDLSMKMPDAASDLLAKMDQGALFALYFGHGSSTTWADENLMNTSSIASLDNEGRYFIMGSFA
ncbi:MAG TPA: C25 family cysteine peptidase, partial [Fibrobacteraceae bacterium]|nr:C25 family cysteine peptidase [Fibrobacteraceae bacterium]